MTSLMLLAILATECLHSISFFLLKNKIKGNPYFPGINIKVTWINTLFIRKGYFIMDRRERACLPSSWSPVFSLSLSPHLLSSLPLSLPPAYLGSLRSLFIWDYMITLCMFLTNHWLIWGFFLLHPAFFFVSLFLKTFQGRRKMCTISY